MATKTKKGNKFFLGALVGAVAGGIAGILTAPQSGKKTRADIERTGKRIANAAETDAKRALKKAQSCCASKKATSKTTKTK